jgi:hypothetical protein
LVRFIQQTTQEGHYFPLSVRQFRELVIQAKEERIQGFTNHIRYGELYNWKLAQVSIPRVIEHNGDWARIELVAGVPYTALEEKKRKGVAEKVIEAAFAQFGKQTPEGEYLINPEFHAGNLMIDAQNNIHLVDCGLIGNAKPKDLLSLFSVLGAFRKEGLAGAAASLFMEKKIKSLKDLDAAKREALLESLKTMEGQIRAGTSPELLLPALSTVVANAGGPRPTTGTETLFRALQHLAPYIRAVGKTPAQFSAMLPATQSYPLASELQKALSKGESDKTLKVLPKGIAIGKKLKDGRIVTIGVLKEEVDLSADSPLPGMIRCPIEGVTQYVKPDDLVIQKGTSWIALAEFKKK